MSYQPDPASLSRRLLTLVRRVQSHTEAAELSGHSLRVITTVTRRYDPELHAKLVTDRLTNVTARAKEIIAAYAKAGSYAAAGAALGISRSRVHQTVQRHAPDLQKQHARARPTSHTEAERRAEAYRRYRTLRNNARHRDRMVEIKLTPDDVFEMLEDFRDRNGPVPAYITRRDDAKGWVPSNMVLLNQEAWTRRQMQRRAQRQLAEPPTPTDSLKRRATRHRLLLTVEQRTPGYTIGAANRYRALVHNLLADPPSGRAGSHDVRLTFPEFLALFQAAGRAPDEPPTARQAVLDMIDRKGPYAAYNLRVVGRIEAAARGSKIRDAARRRARKPTREKQP